MNLNLSGKVALICGASRGIGKAAALQLSSQGAETILFSRDHQKLQIVSDKIKKEFGKTPTLIAGDIKDYQSLISQLSTLPHFQEIQILVNNTSGPNPGSIQDSTTNNFIEAMQAHLFAAHELTKLLIPLMRGKNYGRIINVLSTSVFCPIDNLGVSNTVRASMAAWSKTLSREVAQYNITVNSVLPGATDTDRMKEIISTRSAKTGKTEEELKNEAIAEIPMKRFATPQEIANMIGFLASPAASFVTGTNIRVDGGRTPSLM